MEVREGFVEEVAVEGRFEGGLKGVKGVVEVGVTYAKTTGGTDECALGEATQQREYGGAPAPLPPPPCNISPGI